MPFSVTVFTGYVWTPWRPNRGKIFVFKQKRIHVEGGPKTPFTNKIPGDLLAENMISLHVKITCYLVLM